MGRADIEQVLRMLAVRKFKGKTASERIRVPADQWAALEKVAKSQNYELPDLVEIFLSWAVESWAHEEKEREAGPPPAPFLMPRLFKEELEPRDVRLPADLIRELRRIGVKTGLKRTDVIEQFLVWGLVATAKAQEQQRAK